MRTVGDAKFGLTGQGLVGGILAIVILSLILGVAVNFPLLRRFASGEFRASFLDARKYTGIRFITLAETEDLFARKRQGAAELLFIDSRSRQDYAAGHIPGALSLPLDTVQGSGLLDFPGIQTLVIYCEGGDCQTSLSLAKILHDRGYYDIRIFEGGWEEWRAVGLPEEKWP